MFSALGASGAKKIVFDEAIAVPWARLGKFGKFGKFAPPRGEKFPGG
jgi:hypothetical protein